MISLAGVYVRRLGSHHPLDCFFILYVFIVIALETRNLLTFMMLYKNKNKLQFVPLNNNTQVSYCSYN